MNPNWFNELRERQQLKRAQQEGYESGVELRRVSDLVEHLSAQFAAADRVGDEELLRVIVPQLLAARAQWLALEAEENRRLLKLVHDVQGLREAIDRRTKGN